MKRKGVTVIYTHQILRNKKGNALKIKACRLYSFSEKEKTEIVTFCERLDLSQPVCEKAKEIYFSYLKANIGKGVFNPTPPILASIYLASMGENEVCTMRELHEISEISENTIRKYKNELLGVGAIRKYFVQTDMRKKSIT